MFNSYAPLKYSIEMDCKLYFSLTEFLSVIVNVATILTAIIAVYWFLYSRKTNYYEKEIVGHYRIFSKLINSNNTCAFELKINHVSPEGWFVGNIKYSERWIPDNGGSEGEFNVYGRINYGNLLRKVFFDCIGFFESKSKKHPLSTTNQLFPGVVYILMRNDFNHNEKDWKDFLIESYSITHYRKSHRLHLRNKMIISKPNRTQLPNELFLVNNDIVQDPMFNVKIL